MTGDLFLTSLVIFPFVLVVGYLIQNLLWGRDIGPFKMIVNILAFIGVFFHEISHFILCIFTGIPVRRIVVRLRNEDNGQVAPHGAVVPRRPYQVNFLQAVLAGLGPVLVGAWIIYFALQIALSSLFDPVVRIIAGLIVFSVFLASTPSPQDFRMMMSGFSHDPRHSLYQIVLLLLSIFFAWSTVNLLSLTFPIELIYYFVIIGWYIFLKVSLFGIRWSIKKIRSRVGKEKYRTWFRRLSRRRYKSSKFK